MSTELYIFTMFTHFAGYDSVHFGVHYAAKNEPTGAVWGLMHIEVMDGTAYTLYTVNSERAINGNVLCNN